MDRFRYSSNPPISYRTYVICIYFEPDNLFVFSVYA